MKDKESLKTITLFDYPSPDPSSESASIEDFPIEITDEVTDIRVTSNVLGEGGMGIVFVDCKSLKNGASVMR